MFDDWINLEAGGALRGEPGKHAVMDGIRSGGGGPAPALFHSRGFVTQRSFRSPLSALPVNITRWPLPVGEQLNSM